MFAFEGLLTLDPEGSLPLAPEGYIPSAPEEPLPDYTPPSCCIDSVPEGENNVDNDNGTASGQPCHNIRAPTQYNPQSNVPFGQWVTNQQASVSKFFLYSALDGTFSMDPWG